MKKEGKRMYSYRVPESLYEEIDRMVKLRINDYERRLLVDGGIDMNVEKKSNPADVVVFTNPPAIEVEHYSDNAQLVQEVVPAAKSKPIADAKKEKVKALQEMADTIKNGSSGKSMSFTSVKKPIDEIYDCISVEKGIPAESDRIYYGTNNRIAFWDRDDASVYYANWENKYYQFANSKEFHKFCKDNNIK